MMILHVIRKSKFSAELAAIKISCCVVVDLSTFVTQEGAMIRLLMKEGDTDHTTLHATTITTAITITNTNTAYSANSKLTTLTGIWCLNTSNLVVFWSLGTLATWRKPTASLDPRGIYNSGHLLFLEYP